MTLGYASASARAEIREHLAGVAGTLDKYTHLDPSMPRTSGVSFTAAAAEVRDILHRYEEPFRLAVVGEFNAGKTAAVNALLGRAGLLLEGITPTTGAVTELWWGEQENGEVFGSDGRPLFDAPRPLDEVIRYTDQRTEEGAGIAGQGAKIVLRINAEVLRNLVIIDTPGLGANPEDDKVTDEALYLADAALLVVNGLQPGGEDSLELSERLRVSGRRFLVTVSRLDQVDDPAESLAAARKVFGAVAEGEPIGVTAPAVLRDLADLAAAEAAGDEAASAAARAALDDHGYTELQERLRNSFLAGNAATTRMRSTLGGVAQTLSGLSRAAKEAGSQAGREAEALESELTRTERYIRDSLQPRQFHLNERIEETVDVHVGDFVRDLSDAVEVYIDQLSRGGIRIGIELLQTMAHLNAEARQEHREEFHRKLRQGFEELFPPSQLDITVEQISSSVRTRMAAAWGAAGAEWNDNTDVRRLDPAALVRDVVAQLAKITAAMAANLAAMTALLLIPGGFLVDIALSFLASGIGLRQVRNLPDRVAQAKREARVRVRSQRRELAFRLTKQFTEINDAIADRLIEAASAATGTRRGSHAGLLKLIADWESARTDLTALIDSGTELAGGRR